MAFYKINAKDESHKMPKGRYAVTSTYGPVDIQWSNYDWIGTLGVSNIPFQISFPNSIDVSQFNDNSSNCIVNKNSNTLTFTGNVSLHCRGNGNLMRLSTSFSVYFGIK